MWQVLFLNRKQGSRPERIKAEWDDLGETIVLSFPLPPSLTHYPHSFHGPCCAQHAGTSSIVCRRVYG